MSTAKENPYAVPEAKLEGGVRESGGALDGMLTQLQGTRGWVRFISILLMLAGLMSLFGGLATVVTASISGLGRFSYIVAGMAIFGAVFYVWIGVHLFRYASAIIRALESRAATDVREALGVQRRFWRVASIIGLVACMLGAVNIVATPYYEQELKDAVIGAPSN